MGFPSPTAHEDFPQIVGIQVEEMARHMLPENFKFFYSFFGGKHHGFIDFPSYTNPLMHPKNHVSLSSLQEPAEHKNPKCQDPEAVLDGEVPC